MSMQELYRSLHERWRPEEVAAEIRTVLGDDMTRRDRRILDQACRSRARRWYWSSMPREFAKAVGLEGQIAVARALFPTVEAPRDLENPTDVGDYIDRLDAALSKRGSDFMADRLSREERRELGMKLSRRGYNKRFRLLQRMEGKYGRWLRSREMRELAQIAKTKLALQIRREDFMADRDAACFVAYMTARLGLRSVFTWGRQVRPYDTVAHMLFGRCRASSRAGWLAIAHVYPAQEVLARLTDEQKGQLLAAWYQVMVRSARILEETAMKNDLDLDNLVVRRGNDSSTWNEAAGAFNKARDGWIETLHGLGMEELLERFAPGKALRLMAADVVAMHRNFGSGDLEPDTQVWQELPLPWLVVLGRAQCRRADIVHACERNGVTGKGWIAPRAKHVERFTPTPELVHGVEVSSPELALVLRRCGYFSGHSKGVKAAAPVAIEKRRVGDQMFVSEASD